MVSTGALNIQWWTFSQTPNQNKFKYWNNSQHYAAADPRLSSSLTTHMAEYPPLLQPTRRQTLPRCEEEKLRDVLHRAKGYYFLQVFDKCLIVLFKIFNISSHIRNMSLTSHYHFPYLALRIHYMFLHFPYMYLTI